MISESTIEELEQGESEIKIYNGELETLKNKVPQRIIKLSELQEEEPIDCDKYNYYYEKEKRSADYKTSLGIYATKISLLCRMIKNMNPKSVYRVERKNRPMMEGLGNKIKGFSFFSNKSTGAPADASTAPADASTAPADATPENTNTASPAGTNLKDDTVKKRFGWFGGNSDAKGGRKSRNQRKSRKQRKQRKSRKQRRSRR
jgi:hypothetical protein